MHAHPPRRTLALAPALLLVLCPAPGQAQTGPRLVISDVTVPFETNGGSGQATFHVSFADSTAHGTVTVFYSTTGGTATPGSQCGGNVDYDAVNSAALTFSSTQQTQDINITVCGDTRDEPDETFFVNLFNASGATIQDAQGQATLIDDDPPPSLRISDVSVPEGGPGAVASANFTVTASAASDFPISVSFATSNVSATGGTCGGGNADYANTSGTLNLNPGQTQGTVTVPVCGDGVREGNESFRVSLSNATHAGLADASGTGTIQDDEPLPIVNIGPARVTVREPSTTFTSVNATFQVTLTGTPTTQTVSVYFSTGGGTATGGSTCSQLRLGSTAPGDYVSRSGTLTFPPGTTSLDISIPICHDTTAEKSETFFVKIGKPVNATVGTSPSGEVVIQ